MTRAIAALIDIMMSDAPLRCRIEATEGLLAYEAPDAAVELAKEFLASVFESPEEHVTDRLDALRLMRKAEARRISAPPVAAANSDADRELCREVEIARRRRVRLYAEGLWPAPAGWDADLRSPSYEPPRGSPHSGDIAESVRRGRAKAKEWGAWAPNGKTINPDGINPAKSS